VGRGATRRFLRRYACFLPGTLLLAGGVFFMLRGPRPATPPALPPPHGFDPPRWLRVGMIGVAFASRARPDVTRSREAARERAEEARKKITSGALSFQEAARTFSDHPSAARGGDLGFQRPADLLHLPGAGIVTRLREGEVSPVIRGESGFFLYTRLRYERVYAKVRRFPYGETKKGVVKKGTARSAAYALYSRAVEGTEDPFAGPEGYVGELIPPVAGKALYEAARRLAPGETAPPVDTGSSFIVIRRCRPIQFTFSYIVFPGDTRAPAEKRKLLQRARACLARLRGGGRKAFYAFASTHHARIGWDAPWYKVSKDLYGDRLSRGVYAFLSSARDGDVSAPLVFANGVYLLLKEPFIGLR